MSARVRKPEARGQRLEARGQRLETGSWERLNIKSPSNGASWCVVLVHFERVLGASGACLNASWKHLGADFLGMSQSILEPICACWKYVGMSKEFNSCLREGGGLILQSCLGVDRGS